MLDHLPGVVPSGMRLRRGISYDGDAARIHVVASDDQLEVVDARFGYVYLPAPELAFDPLGSTVESRDRWVRELGRVLHLGLDPFIDPRADDGAEGYRRAEAHVVRPGSVPMCPA